MAMRWKKDDFSLLEIFFFYGEFLLSFICYDNYGVYVILLIYLFMNL